MAALNFFLYPVLLLLVGGMRVGEVVMSFHHAEVAGSDVALGHGR